MVGWRLGPGPVEAGMRSPRQDDRQDRERFLMMARNLSTWFAFIESCSPRQDRSRASPSIDLCVDLLTSIFMGWLLDLSIDLFMYLLIWLLCLLLLFWLGSATYWPRSFTPTTNLSQHVPYFLVYWIISSRNETLTHMAGQESIPFYNSKSRLKMKNLLDVVWYELVSWDNMMKCMLAFVRVLTHER